MERDISRFCLERHTSMAESAGQEAPGNGRPQRPPMSTEVFATEINAEGRERKSIMAKTASARGNKSLLSRHSLRCSFDLSYVLVPRLQPLKSRATSFDIRSDPLL